MQNQIINIATGKSRKELSWKNRETTWPELVKRLSETHRTTETHAEYLSSKKPRQDEIKDVGGFVGGYLQGGRRKAGNVLHRQLLTLDLDFAPYDLWEEFSLMWGCAAVLYSTHKHSPAAPRFRIVIPMDREVFPDEYEAVARRFAGTLDIEWFDPSTFQPERLMYWPSTSKDGEYVFKEQQGSWLCADDLLREYTNWRDTSEWEVSAKVDKVVKRTMQKQGDPLDKRGVVGAFCRSFTVQEAIENYLSDVYEPCENGRYSYKEGSTSGGLVTYEDKWVYGHHGTDPVSNKLCNAFDLIRIHKFGLQDEDAKEGTPGNKLPSYISMLDFSTKEPEVRKQIGAEKMQDALQDFNATLPDEESNEWIAELETDRKGNYASSIHNIYVFLKNSPGIRNRMVYDEFENRLICTKNLPWREVTEQTKDFTDDDTDCLAHYLETQQIPFTQIPRALSKIRNEFRTHPVKDYLEQLKWDEEERMEKVFIDYLGAADTEYVRSVTRKTLIGAVSRIFEPGCKFDTVLTLIGKKGVGKSTIIDKLGGRWFSDTMGDIHDKSGMENLRGVWIMEIAELASFKKADQEAIKKFITSREDMYRPAYGKQSVRYPRQCIFFGTTNKQDFLTESDERRFLPIDTLIQEPVKNIWKDLNPYEINQIWAEAVQYYKANESCDLSAEVKALAERIRERHTVKDEREGLIEGYLDLLLPDDWSDRDVFKKRAFIHDNEGLEPEGVQARNIVCAAEIWCELFSGSHKEMTTQNTKFIHDIMKKQEGWKPTKSVRNFNGYGKQRGYERYEKEGQNR